LPVTRKWRVDPETSDIGTSLFGSGFPDVSRTPSACHSVGGGDKLGPDVLGASQRHDAAWLTRWLKSPEQMLQSDATAKALLAKWKVPMPNQGLSDEEIKQYLAYFKWADQNLHPQGKAQPPSTPVAAASQATKP